MNISPACLLTIVTDDTPILALGSPGGSTIITTVLQVLVNDLDFGMTLPQAIAAPRASQRNTTQTSAEPAFLSSPEAALLVSRYGQSFTSTPEIGAAAGIAFLPDGTVQAAAEPVRRGGGSALVENPAPRGVGGPRPTENGMRKAQVLRIPLLQASGFACKTMWRPGDDVCSTLMIREDPRGALRGE